MQEGDPADEREACSICLQPKTAATVVPLRCGHSFHPECIVSWFQTKATHQGGGGGCCPLCRDGEVADSPPCPFTEEELTAFVKRIRKKHQVQGRRVLLMSAKKEKERERKERDEDFDAGEEEEEEETLREHILAQEKKVQRLRRRLFRTRKDHTAFMLDGGNAHAVLQHTKITKEMDRLKRACRVETGILSYNLGNLGDEAKESSFQLFRQSGSLIRLPPPAFSDGDAERSEEGREEDVQQLRGVSWKRAREVWLHQQGGERGGGDDMMVRHPEFPQPVAVKDVAHLFGTIFF